MKTSALVLFAASLLAASPGYAADKDSWSTIQRGLYLTHAGDCAACHTVDASKPFAGDYSLKTPFGVIYSANLTPDAETGLGKWTDDDFYHAMTMGRDKDGTRLYPAFPYTHFTIISREDSDDIFAYLKSLKPIRQHVREPDFIWPLTWRFLMRGWNMINFEPHAFSPDSGKSAEWNRGKYLVEGLEHCAMCHSPKNITGAEKDGGQRFTGGAVEGWWAPSLTGDRRDGIGDWTKDQLIAYLKYGRNEKSAAIGPMTDVIEHSTRYLHDDDLSAIATYVKGFSTRADRPDDDSNTSAKDQLESEVGAQIYAAQCSACHAPEGAGVPTMFAPLKGSSLVQSANPRSMLRLILDGGRAAVSDKYPTPHAMPAFDWKFTDAQIAAVATYVRNSFGNRASAVSADDVADLRGDLSKN